MAQPKTCYLAAVQHARLAPDAERFMIGQYFLHLYARSRYGSSVSVAQLTELLNEGFDDKEVAQAAPLFETCLKAYPLASSMTPVSLPQDPLEKYALCFAAHVAIPSLMAGLLRERPPPPARRAEVEALAERAIELEDRMIQLAPELRRVHGLDWPTLSQKTDEMTARLPDTGRQDRIIDACLTAYGAPSGAKSSGG